MNIAASFSRRVLLSLALCAGVLALSACSLMPERVAAGTPRAEIESRLGKPTLVHALPDGGTRLQYSGQPAGQWVHNMDLDAQGRLLRQTQVLDAGWLQQNIQIGHWTRDDVYLNLGKPALIERVARFDGVIWTYRFLEMGRPRQVHVHLDPAGVVRQLMFTDEPMDDPGDASYSP